MTLEEMVSGLADEQVICIGCASAFIYIGTVADCKKKFEALDTEFIEKAKTYIRVAQREQKYLNNNGICLYRYRNGKKIEMDLATATRIHKRKLKDAEAREQKYKDYIETFEPFRVRAVRESYRRLDNELVILINGEENGAFWLRSEYERGRTDETSWRGF